MCARLASQFLFTFPLCTTHPDPYLANQPHVCMCVCCFALPGAMMVAYLAVMVAGYSILGSEIDVHKCAWLTPIS